MKTIFFFLLTSLASGLFSRSSAPDLHTNFAAISPGAPAFADSVSKRMNDTEFLISAYNNGMYEVKAAKLARRMTGNRSVRKFAVARLASQEAANKDIIALLTIKGITPPNELPAGLKARFEDLNSWMGKEFNDKYLGGTIENEKDYTALYHFVSTNSKDGDVRHFAANAVGQFEAREDSAVNLLKYVDRPATSTW